MVDQFVGVENAFVLPFHLYFYAARILVQYDACAYEIILIFL